MTTWTLAARAAKVNPEALRGILRLPDTPGLISLAGGLPAPQTFPIEAFTQACNTILARDGADALQYATSEGYAPLRQAVADMLPWDVDPDQVLITNGSQQALDLIGTVFLDKGSRMMVELPTYLGALQAFQPQEAITVGVACDEDGILIDDFAAKAGTGADKVRFAYVLPNFQNPTGRSLSEERRNALVAKAAELNIPLIEDNPYGDLWFGEAPPAPLTARNPEGCIYLGSFSKILAPGLRVGFLVAPKAVYPKLLQAKQAADLHTPGLNQYLVNELLKDGFLQHHVPTIRALYQGQRDTMLAALERDMVGLGVTWTRPAGGMFLWVRLPEGMDAQALRPLALARNVAFVPGMPFYASGGDPRTLRLSFVTASSSEIDTAITALAEAIREHAHHSSNLARSTANADLEATPA